MNLTLPGFNRSDNFIKWFIIFVFTAFFAFAVFAWFERMNTDAGYYLWNTINKKSFHVEHGRYVLAIAEILPLLGVWIHLPLKAVVILYSINHVLFFAISAWFCYKISNSWNGPITIALLSFCGLSESVFTPQFELYYGLVFLINFIVLLNHYLEFGGTIKSPILLFVFAIFAITSHPMGLVCLLFVLLLNELYFRRYSKKIWISFLIISILYYFWKKANITDYEGGKFQAFFGAFLNGQWRNIFQFNALKAGCIILWKTYPDVIVLFFLGLFFWLKERKYLALLIYIGGILFCLSTVWLVWDPSSIVNRYLEQVYYPFVFSVFVFIYWAISKYRQLIFIVAAIFIFRANTIHRSFEKFHTRAQNMDLTLNVANSKPGQRFIVFKKNIGDENYNMADWSYGFETMVRSAIKLKRTITITKDEDIYYNHNDSLLKPDEYLDRMWEIRNKKYLNKTYFHLEDGKYILLYND